MSVKIKQFKSITKEIDESLETLYAKYFKKEDTEADLNFKTMNYLLKKFPKSEAIAIDGKIIVGETIIIPTNRKLMTEFLDNKIDEQKFVDKSLKKVTLKNFNAIYLCYMIIEKKYRHKKITLNEHKKILDYYLKYNNKVILFVWVFSKAGEATAKKVAETYKLPLIIKK